MASDLANHAYGHCMAVLLAADPAEEAGRETLRRGARTVVSVLAYARLIALGDTGSEPGDIRSDDLSGADLTDVARRLTASRPKLERAIVDLQGRHQLDRARFARTLGLNPTAAAARAAVIADAWATSLDPALLARLGPGECDGLAEVLVARGLISPKGEAPEEAEALEEPEVQAAPAPPAPPGPPEPPAPAMTVEDLVAAVPAVTAHLDGCQPCRDRLRAMVSVHDLVTGIPLETAPASVRVVLRPASRRRLAVSMPPAIDDGGGRPRRPRLLAAGVAIGALALGLGAIAGTAAVANHLNRSGQSDRVQALAKLPAANALSVQPTTIFVPGGTFVLTNRSDRSLQWRAASPVPWLALQPNGGTLGPQGQVVLRAEITGGAPGGMATTTVAITGDDGSATGVGAITNDTGLPDVAASIKGCTVTTTAVASQGISEVVLHWKQLLPAAGPENIIAMTKGATGYTAVLPSAAVPIQWWVAVTSAAGDQTPTAVQVLPANTCG